ncbi:Fe(3+)-hydroxamate ABC transporter permease FhuB [Bosea sp. (in: a-proteobacteria)]|jgi:iron complex transport system permease protein|uniref:Fe(3+)-hydroxamate ABC transporter permease FhuB n=1 Tax=Bosea sp. (in: a-proteobacteria) TaxID=1871050 RepID=UPI002DDD6B43|nr:Fe(3+)-hydroxamate ABC transporter permease FhuB [Bosea sp. (in: a-proteobacteria)]HEV2508825.1 Fe(3+)-hydroxamate ABC transporter permease FhuB [Bosea sp. (in: a-proteobacteria)]
MAEAIMPMRSQPLRPSVIWLAAALVTVALFAAIVMTRPSLTAPAELARPLEAILLWHSLVPRSVTALICGAALGLAGLLLQRVLRNPIADASTLGVVSGAQLALTVATAFAPAAIVVSREGVALAGAVAAVALVLGLSWRRGLEPLTVVLSGMVVALLAAALSATVILAKGEYMLSLFIWGAGSLNQQSWDGALSLGPCLLLSWLAAALLLRPLALLSLDDGTARSLGLALHATRIAVLGVAIWLAASVTAEVGVIGFVGLAAPALAREIGARTPRQLLLAAPAVGALLLSITDSAVQLLGSGFADFAPTGAATALFGGPLLLWLMHRVPPAPLAQSVDAMAPTRRIARPWPRLAALAAAIAAIAVLGLVLGRGPQGWGLATGDLLAELLPFRGPRLIAAGAAGALLGAAGCLMQRLTANPLAGPEVLGVSAGGGVGLTLALALLPFSPFSMLIGIAGGSLGVLLIMLVLAGRPGIGSQRLLLAGIAMGALCMALVSTALAKGDLRAYVLLTWLSGSTNRAGEIEVWVGLVGCLVLIAPLFLATRWLDLMPLGEATSRSLGLGVERSRLVLAAVAALATAVASLLIGPLSLIGLIAPHLARLAGFARARDQLVASILTGCGVMILADWLARLVAFPYQVPTGLFAALIGGPYLIWLLNRTGRRHG